MTSFIPQTKTKRWIISLSIIGGTLLIGIIGSLLGGKMNEDYLQPPLFPPQWFFPVAWTVNYVAMAIAAYLAYASDRVSNRRNNDLIWYGVHLFFNLLWPLFFFRLNLLLFAIIWLIFNILSAFIVTCRYYKSNLASGIIFTVYMFWLLYALYLNFGVAVLNV